MSFVKNKFADMNDDEMLGCMHLDFLHDILVRAVAVRKKKYMEKEAELKQQYNEEVKTYKEGERYKASRFLIL